MLSLSILYVAQYLWRPVGEQIGQFDERWVDYGRCDTEADVPALIAVRPAHIAIDAPLRVIKRTIIEEAL